MELTDSTHELLSAKKAQGLSFADLCAAVGRGEIWVAALLYGQASALPEEAQKLAAALGLDETIASDLVEAPLKGLGSVVPTDPVVYRFYEIIQVYGMALKQVIHEKFGDGIMSAVDLTMQMGREEHPEGVRVNLTMSGKFLPYRRW